MIDMSKLNLKAFIFGFAIGTCIVIVFDLLLWGNVL